MSMQRGPQAAAEALAEVVSAVRYKAGWAFWLADMRRPTEHLAGSAGLTLCVAATVIDSGSTPVGNDVLTTRVEHWFAVPPTSWDRPTWERWVLDCIVQVETHEAMEFYALVDDSGTAGLDGLRKPFFPAHGPGRDPYVIERRAC